MQRGVCRGVFFLSGSFATDQVKRTCTVLAHMPILFHSCENKGGGSTW
jgi:hypothetical protein